LKTHAPLYDEDFYAWTQEQAALLRAKKWRELDYGNLAEELEALGKRDRRELEHRLEVLVMHLLKWHYQPERRDRSRGWRSTIREQRRRLTRLLRDSPSLRSEVPALLDDGYPHACGKALDETRLPPETFPPTCPWTAVQVLDDAFWPEA
jgi:Domain of unknown function DUF29